ncbi:hypothetical protein, partial [Sporosarcina sp. D27]|uniref:hypothetical protein n=1 Tax=Sporosarcina sp. D27 TaxID=1382305 RepID=UPI001C0FAC3F
QGLQASLIPPESPLSATINRISQLSNEVMEIMMKNQIKEREQMEMLAIEQLVLRDHLVLKIEAAIDFSFIYQ